jgi:hypothetical protein
MLRRYPDVIGLASTLALTALVAWDHLTAGRGLYRVDIVTQYLPWYTYLGQHLRHGDIPGWLPNSLSGTPFAGDPQSGWMYLPVMAIFTLFSGVTGFGILIVFHLLLAGLSTYALARVLGMVPIGAVIAATAYEFGAFLERVRCCTIHAEVGAWLPLAFLGVELAVRSRSWFARVGWWAVAGLALSQMIAGWIGQGAYYGLLATCAYILYRTLIAPNGRHPLPRGSEGDDAARSPSPSEGRGGRGVRDTLRTLPTSFRSMTPPARHRLRSAAFHLGAVVAIGLGLAVGALWPRFETVAATNLAGGDYSQISEDAADTGGWGVLALADHLLSDDDRLGRWYLGGAIFALAFVAPFAARRLFGVPFFTGLALVTMILTLHEGPVHYLFYLLPRFRQLHQHLPDHVLTVFYLAPSLMAGATVSAIRGWPSRWKASLIALAPLAIAGIVDNRIRADPLLGVENGSHIPAETLASIAAVGLLLLLLVWVRGSRLWTIATVALAVVVFLDPTGRLVIGRLDGSPDDALWSTTVTGYTEASGAALFLQQRQAESTEPFRFFGYDARLAFVESGPVRRTYVSEYRDPEVMSLLVNNQGILLGLQDVQGYNPVQLSLYSAVIRAVNRRLQGYHTANVLTTGWNSPVLALLNIRYVVIPSQVPPGRPDLLHLSQRYHTVYTDQHVRVIEVDDALPRAWIVHDLRKAEPATILQSLRKREFDPRQTALLSTDPPATARPDDPTQDRATVVAYGPERIKLTTSSGAAGLLVLSEIDNPDWHASVDGHAVRIYQTDRVLRGVPIPAGDHVVELRYDQPSLRRGLLASAATALVVALLMLALGLRRFRRLSPASAPPLSAGSPARRRSRWTSRTRGRRPRSSPPPGD